MLELRDRVDVPGLDVALWDLAGKIREQPIWAMLGGSNRIRAYASSGVHRSPAEIIAELVDASRSLVAAGEAVDESPQVSSIAR